MYEQHLFLLCFTAIGLFLIHHFVISPPQQDKEKDRLWATLNFVGVPSRGLFSWTRALLRSLTSMQENTIEGYNKFSKPLSLPFALPTIWVSSPVTVLPPSLLHVLNKPESKVRALDAQLETIQLPYLISDRDIYMNAIHFDVVRKHLVNNKDVEALASTTADEVGVALRDCWGTSQEWTELNGWDVCGRVVTRAATRILIGLPLCRDETFFEQMRLFSDAVIMGTAMINCLPPSLRPLFGPLIALRAKYYHSRCLKILVPFVKERIQIWATAGDLDENDFLQWMIPKCAKEGPEQMTPIKLASRLLTFNVMFIAGMNYVFAHSVLDIYGSPSKNKFVNGLESECRQVSSKYGGFSTKEALDRLHRVDSAIRESMRVSDIAITALARDVASDTLDLGNGIEIPRGVRIVFPTQPVHQDPSNYENPLHFDAFRFSRRFEGVEDMSGHDRTPTRESLTTITPSWLAFGYGKHACPGRWFASQTMKQAIANILLHYDVEVLYRPKKRRVILNMMVPATDARIRIRRKP
ncbi:cytochrome P450 [Lentithecium fluviatile CBS 122367]|uniref:Cytochrome P450 n=1 Tax=Lentithecium fluviatile CBS 122367 TaxID=1168545 RepID=A0A6G1IZ09_9PLEO|nr:cytochrome P450 [Lentithecium fluviatile CBS 122367]